MTCISLLVAVSLHLGLEGSYNPVHPQVRCTVNNTMAGVYYNSEDQFSSYLAQKFGVLEVGIVTGYESAKVLPMVRIIKGNWFIASAYETNPKNYGVVLGFEYKI